MTNSTSAHDESNDRLDQVLAEYLRSVDSGKPLDRQALVEKHPDLADDLRSFFANRDSLERVARPLAGQIPFDELTLAPSDSAGSPRHVRYLGAYELMEEIARGGMGVVYKARQVKLNRIVAVKMILAGQLAGEDAVKRFHAEARAAAGLHHPNIVAIHEVGEHDGQHYFSMDFVDGESLAARIARGPMPAREAAELLRRVANAISFAHDENVIHRDLKPANILLDRDGEPHVSDFGLAKHTAKSDDAADHSLTATGQVLGTPSYMPPEQAAGKLAEIGPHSDVYSLGAILYCMLTGRPPFQAASALDTLMQVLESEPVSPRSLNPAVPVDLNTICLKCLEKDPARRYASSVEFAEELERFLRGEPIRARPLGLLENTWRRLRRHQRILQSVAATIAATVLVAALGYLIWDWQREQRMGRLALRTDGLPLSAELRRLDAGSSSLAFTIPTEQPLQLAGGEYRLRATGAGMLSQDFMASVASGKESAFSIDLTEDQFWPQFRLDAAERVDLVTNGKRTDVLLFENRFQRSTLQRLEGSTLRPVWSLPIDSVQTAPPGLDPALLNLWRDLAQPWRWSNHRPLWIGLDKSIDGDPQADLIACWPTHDDLPFIAFSGADGTIRWIKSTTGQFDRLAARPLVADVDGDPAPDLVRLGYRYGQGNLWIEAVSGGSGKTVWRSDLPMLTTLNPSDAKQGVYVEGEEYLFPCEIAHAKLAGDPVVVSMTPHQMLVVRLPNGEPVAAPLAFGSPLAARPQLADVNGDGTHELFWQTTSTNSSDRSISMIDAHLQSLGAPDDRRISLKAESNVSQQRLARLAGQNWGRITDLDHDGKYELLVPREYGSIFPVPRSTELAIRVYDATTGQQRWHHTVYPREGAICEDILTTPDANKDGCEEVLVISSGPASEREDGYRSFALYVDVLDGAAGKRLATWKEESIRNDLGGFASNRRFESARWWGADARGFPQLVVATIDETAHRNRRRLHIISPLEGRETHRLEDVGPWQLPDLDGDGLGDLWVSRESPDGQQFQAFRTKSPIVWRRLGTLQTAQDFDRDELAEYLEVDYEGGRNIKILGGTDGRLVRTIHPVWTTRELHAPLQAFTWPAPLGNLGGDVTADLVLAGEYHLNPLQESARAATHLFPLQAIDGGTGKVLWREPKWSLPAEMLDRAPQGVYVVGIEVRGEDFDADGRLELLVAYRLEWGEARWSGMCGQLWLAAVDSRNGAFLWQRPVGDIRRLPSAIGSDELPWYLARELLDLNGDGTRDLVLTVPRHQTEDTYPQGPFKFDIEAVSGRDGSALWPPHRLSTALSNIRHSDPMTARMPDVAVAVLASGQNPSIVVAETILDPVNFDAAATTRTCRVTVLQASDGSEAWRFDWQSGGTPNEHAASQINIATMDVGGKGELSIVAREYDQAPNDGGDALTWLTHRGELIRRTIADKSWAYQPATTRLWPIDVDGDGRAELALTRGGRIRLQRPDGSLVWPDSLQRFGEVIAVETGPKQSRLIVVDGTGYSAIDARTGHIKWRCEMGAASVSHPRETRLVPSGTPNGLPRILAVGQDSVVREALRVNESGDYQLAVREIELAAPPFDSRFLRRLPWDYPGPNTSMGLAALCGFALIVVPLGAIRLAVRRGRWSLKSWLMAPALVSYVIVAANLLMRLGDGQSAPPSVGQLWTLAASGTFALVFPALVVRWAWRRQWLRLSALLVGSLGLSLLFGGIGYVNAALRLGPNESFRWTWTPLLNLWLPAAIISGWIGAIATTVARVTKRRTLSAQTATNSSRRWPLLRCGLGAVALLAGAVAMLGAMFVAYRARDMSLPLVPFAIWCVIALGSLAGGVWCVRGLGRSQPGARWIYIAVAIGGVIAAIVAVFATDASVEAVSNTTYQLSMRVWGCRVPLTRGELESLEPAMLVLGVGLGWMHVLAGGTIGALAGGLAHGMSKARKSKTLEP